jgi:hypothetical protein
MRLKGFSVRRIASDFTESKYLLRAIASDNDWDYLRRSAAGFFASGKLYEPIFLSTSAADSERINSAVSSLPGIAFLRPR